MKILPTLLAAALSLSQIASAAGLNIDYLTPGIECSRKSKKGDNIEVHYRGTLQETGKEFDSSYSRGSPLPFQLGAGRVIKGYVNHTPVYIVSSPLHSLSGRVVRLERMSDTQERCACADILGLTDGTRAW